MFTALEVYSPQFDIPTLMPATAGIEDDFFQVRNVEGLGPVKANVNTTPYATIDGESYSGSFVGKRNIVITFGLNPNYTTKTLSDLRHLLYRYFMPKGEVTLNIFSNNLPAVGITGIVESVEPSIFSKDPEVQVSVLCPNADFVAISPTVVAGTVSDGTTPDVIDYTGNVETGFVLKVESSFDVASYTGPLRIIAQSVVSEVFITTVTVNSTNFFEMSSVRGRKYARSIRVSDHLTTNRFAAVDTASKWPVLHPGNNNFAVVSQVGYEGQAWELTYFPRFGGL